MGGFTASSWLRKEVQETLEPSRFDIFRPEDRAYVYRSNVQWVLLLSTGSYKAVLDGVTTHYLNDLVQSFRDDTWQRSTTQSMILILGTPKTLIVKLTSSGFTFLPGASTPFCPPSNTQSSEEAGLTLVNVKDFSKLLTKLNHR